MSFWLVALLALPPQEEVRQLPGLWRAVALLGQLDQPGTSASEARRIAKEAHDASLEADLAIDLKDFPRAMKALGAPESIQARAWRAYQKHRDPATDPARPFPERRRTTPARCDQSEVDHARAYLTLAIEAGPEPFAAAISTLRSAVEIGEALELLPQWDDPRAVATGLELVERLRRATASRREFAAAKDLRAQLRRFAAIAPAEAGEAIEETWRYYQSRNESLEACGGDAEASSEESFADLKYKVLRLGTTPATEYEFVEQFLRLYEMARGDQALLMELERAGDPRLRLLVTAFRTANRRAER